MKRLSDILSFTKIEHTVFSLPMLFAGAYLGNDRRVPGVKTLVLIMLAGVGARVLGMAMNRIMDREIDALNPRTSAREIPSGRISLAGAYSIAAFGLILYLLACHQFGPLILALSPIPAFALILYSLLKRVTWLCHYGIGLVLALAPVSAYVAVRGQAELSVDVLLVSGFTFFWMSGFDIIYALQDADFDKAHRVFSIPGVFGVQKAAIVSACTHVLAVFMLSLMFYHSVGLFSAVAFITSVSFFVLAHVSAVPLKYRFFPISAVAGMAGSIVVFY